MTNGERATSNGALRARADKRCDRRPRYRTRSNTCRRQTTMRIRGLRLPCRGLRQCTFTSSAFEAVCPHTHIRSLFFNLYVTMNDFTKEAPQATCTFSVLVSVYSALLFALPLPASMPRRKPNRQGWKRDGQRRMSGSNGVNNFLFIYGQQQTFIRWSGERTRWR